MGLSSIGDGLRITRSHKVVEIFERFGINTLESLLVKVLAIPGVLNAELSPPGIQPHHPASKT